MTFGNYAVAVVLLSFAFMSSCGGGGNSNTTPVQPPVTVDTSKYINPISPIISGSTAVESCPDPSIIYGTAEKAWFLYCTGNPLNDNDKVGSQYRDHLITVNRSTDLAQWTYIGDALSARPAWAAAASGIWAPNIEFFNGKYYLYFTVPETTFAGGSSAIGVATSTTPVGPWTVAADPVVEPNKAPCCAASDRWTIDPDVVDYNGQLYILYGSYNGGISVRKLSADGLHSDGATQVEIASPDRYEAANLFKHNGYYYLFVSAADCCRGALTGYTLFVGRAATPTGPFLDRDGISLADARTGGTLVMSNNGERWVGAGHNAVFSDFAGQDWTVYHAIDKSRPYFAGTTDTRRPAMLDAIDWVSDWPVVRGGFGASSTEQPRPAAQPGESARYAPTFRTAVNAGALDATRSDEFNTNAIDAKWTWVRPPATGVRMNGSALEFDTQAAELFESTNSASILSQPAPSGDYIVETRMHFNVPASGCCFNYAQSGLVVFADDDNYVKLTHTSIGWSRQIEFGKEISAGAAGYARYGDMVLEAPSDWTWLRIMKRTVAGEERYTAFSSTDGVVWKQGGTWTHALGASARIGLVSQSIAGYTAEFDYVRVYAVAP